ncbi:MAG: TlpA family protein disulfide reductase [Rikenellaceae bacterium]|nr:TlpA family protein disulfide reductase [Rikenellaceae bacterium]MCL2692003.1 TlpA family protein disulfide reductase [Rikenellaceae bacterium]
MKRASIFIVAAAIAVAAACGVGRQAKTYLITGSWEGGDGNTVYVFHSASPSAREAVPDEILTVVDGRFEITSSEVGRIITLAAGEDGYRKTVIFEDEPLHVVVRPGSGQDENKMGIEVPQTPEQEMIEAARSSQLMTALFGLGRMMQLSNVRDDPVAIDSVLKAFAMMDEHLANAFEARMDTTTNLMATAYMIESHVLPNRPIEDGVRFYEQLTPRVRESAAGRSLRARIDERLDVNVGGIAPEIDLPGPDGVHIKLSSLRGKYVLIDFWASWCGPCLREVPNLKAIHDDFHAKGFEIYGVSLDEEHQRDAWLQKIADYHMDWPQVSSLQGWTCPTAQRYAVTGIPKLLLLDREGRIIADGLRGEALREKVASLFE